VTSRIRAWFSSQNQIWYLGSFVPLTELASSWCGNAWGRTGQQHRGIHFTKPDFATISSNKEVVYVETDVSMLMDLESCEDQQYHQVSSLDQWLRLVVN